MNRRRFLQFTIALAVTAPLARVLITAQSAGPATMTVDPGPRLGAVWVPTQAEVDEWLEYYKICVQQGCQTFADIVGTVMTGRPEHEKEGLGTRWAATPEESEAEHQLFLQAERAFAALESDRRAVAYSQGTGYAAGRDGLPRHTVAYTAPSNEAFGWYNMWEVGDRDRRGVKVPRSPGVTWPDGRKPSSVDRFS